MTGAKGGRRTHSRQHDSMQHGHWCTSALIAPGAGARVLSRLRRCHVCLWRRSACAHARTAWGARQRCSWVYAWAGGRRKVQAGGCGVGISVSHTWARLGSSRRHHGRRPRPPPTERESCVRCGPGVPEALCDVCVGAPDSETPRTAHIVFRSPCAPRRVACPRPSPRSALRAPRRMNRACDLAACLPSAWGPLGCAHAACLPCCSVSFDVFWPAPKGASLPRGPFSIGSEERRPISPNFAYYPLHFCGASRHARPGEAGGTQRRCMMRCRACRACRAAPQEVCCIGGSAYLRARRDARPGPSPRRAEYPRCVRPPGQSRDAE